MAGSHYAFSIILAIAAPVLNNCLSDCLPGSACEQLAGHPLPGQEALAEESAGYQLRLYLDAD